MNEPQTPVDLKALLAAAKADGPSAAGSAKIWSAVSSSIAPGAPAGLGGLGLGATKLAGGLFGGTITVGLTAAAFYFGTPRAPHELPSRQGVTITEVARPSGMTPAAVPAALPLAPSPSALTPAADAAPRESAASADVEPVSKPAARSAGSRAQTGPSRLLSPEDALAREASLVASARRALARGDAKTALATIRATRTLASRQMRPEELAVEAQALRALGNVNDADAVELNLRVAYPESALAQ